MGWDEGGSMGRSEEGGREEREVNKKMRERRECDMGPKSFNA